MGRKQQKKQQKTTRPDQPSQGTSRSGIPAQQLWLAAIIAIAAFLCYANTLDHGYALDDKAVITENRFTKQGVQGIPALVTHGHFYGYNNAQSGLYRPIPLITHALEYELFGQSPSISHLVNILLYCSLCVGLFLVLAQWTHGHTLLLPFFAALLYTVHPLHTELVANIKGRDEILVFLFLLLSLWSVFRYVAEDHRPGWLFLSLGAYLLALFTKENALTFLAIIPLAMFVFARSSIKQIALHTLPFVGAAVIYLLIRSQFVEAVGEYRFFDSYFQYAPDRSDRIATAVGNFAQHVRLLVFPYPLVYDYSYDQIPTISWSHPRAIFSLIGIITLLGFAIYQLPKRTLLSFCILFYFITISVVANVITPTSAVFAERFLFIPSLSFCLLIAYGIQRLLQMKHGYDWSRMIGPSSNKLALGAFLVVLLAGAGRTIHRNQAWQNDLTLFKNDLAHTQNNARTHYNLGRYYLLHAETSRQEQYLQRSLTLLREAVAIHPNFTNAYQLLASGYEKTGQLQKAISHMRKYIKLARNDRKPIAILETAYRDLGSLYHRVGKSDSVSYAFQQAININPQRFENYFSFGNNLFNLQRYRKAVTQYKKALKINPNSYDCYYNIAAAYVNLGQYKKARQYLQKALQVRPGDQQAKQLLQKIKGR